MKFFVLIDNSIALCDFQLNFFLQFACAFTLYFCGACPVLHSQIFPMNCHLNVHFIGYLPSDVHCHDLFLCHSTWTFTWHYTNSYLSRISSNVSCFILNCQNCQFNAFVEKLDCDSSSHGRPLVWLHHMIGEHLRYASYSAGRNSCYFWFSCIVFFPETWK